MVATSGPSHSSPLAPALRDLARARTRARLVRVSLWVWCSAILVWLLPLGSWTATGLRPSLALIMGSALVAGAGVLVLLYRSVSRMDGIRAAILEAKLATPTAEDLRVEQQRLPLGWDIPTRSLLTAAGIVILLAAPIVYISPVLGRGGMAAWLLQPIATLILAARWRQKGAAAGIVISVATFAVVEGLLHDGAVFRDPAVHDVAIMTLVLTVVNPIAVLSLDLLVPGGGGMPLYTEDSRRAAERARRILRSSDHRIDALLESASDVMTILDADGVRRGVSPSVAVVLGYGPNELVETSFFALIHPDDMERMVDFHLACLEQPGISPPIEFRYRGRDGSWRYLEAIFNNRLADPEVGGIVVNARDITERKKFEEQLTRQAYYDALTGLPNRTLFRERLAQSLARAARHGYQLAVMFIDLDRFKVINDSLGHGAGDALLIAVTQRLSSCVRAKDTVARFGGDEFTVLLDGIESVEEALRVANRMIEQARQPFMIDGHEVFTGASIGIRPVQAGEQPEELLRDADAALYQAKAAGKGRAVIFDDSMTTEAVERLDLETDLSWAVERGEMRVHYQPEVDLETGEIVGMEALVRWEHPRRGMIAPAEFIPLAEETGLILQIGHWVMEEACRQACIWKALRPEKDPLIMSVNLSIRQLQQPGLVAEVAEILERTGMEPGHLRLEITESMLMSDVESTTRTLQALKQLGVRLALDDFGTGYSSLNYLTQFVADTIKIDRSFVKRLETDRAALAVVQAVMSLARALGMDVTAEGIETPEQLAKAQLVHCDHGQGYYFSRPVPTDVLTRMLHEGPAWSAAPSTHPRRSRREAGRSDMAGLTGELATMPSYPECDEPASAEVRRWSE